MDEQGGKAFLFQCAACGRQYSVALDKVPATGARGACKNCGKPITVYPDGRLEGARPEASSAPAPVPTASRTPDPSHSDAPPSPAGPPPASADGDAWELQLGGETVGPFGPAEIGELIRQGRVEAGSPVRTPGGAWSTAAAFPALAALFQETAEEPPQGSEDQCYAHPEAPPAFQCSRCMRFLCERCPKESHVMVGGHPLRICPACGGMAKPWTKGAQRRPFYQDMKQVLLSPLRGHALLYLIILAIVEIFKIPCWTAAKIMCFFILAVLFLNAFQWAFFLHVVQQVAHGSYDFPEWPETDQIGDMVWDFFKVLLVTLISLVPVIVIGVAATRFLGLAPGAAATGPWFALAVFLGLLYAFYLPIPIAIVAVFKTVLPALNPILIARIISRIGLPYLAAYALWISLFVISTAVHRALVALPIPMVGAVLAAPVTIYVMLVNVYILGRLIHENEDKIGWM